MRAMRNTLALRLCELLALGAMVSTLGCSEKDATKCQEALDGTRKSLAAADANLITQWRERAYKYCADTAALATLDREITDKQAADAAAKAAEAQHKAENDALVKAFTGWAGDSRLAPDHASATPVCDGDDPSATKPAEPKTHDRFCTATRQAGTYPLSVRYWDADKTILMFTTKPSNPVTCDDIGPNKVLKTWDVPALTGQSVKRTRCELTSGTLTGLNVVVSAASEAPVYIFSVSYLEKDPGLKVIAGG